MSTTKPTAHPESYVLSFRDALRNTSFAQSADCALETEERTAANEHFRALASEAASAALATGGDSLLPLTLMKEAVAKSTTHANFLYAAAGVPFVVQQMTAHADNVQVQIVACDIVASFHGNTDAQQEVGERGGVHAVLKALIKFMKHRTMVEAGLRCLRHLSLLQSNRELMVENGVFEVIVAGLDFFGNSEGLVENAVVLVASDVYGNSDARSKFGEVGGIATLTEAMRIHMSSSHIQGGGAEAFRNLAFDCPANIDLMRGAGTLDVMFRALEKHRPDFSVTRQILAATGNIVSDSLKAKVHMLAGDSYCKRLFLFLSEAAENPLLCKKIFYILNRLCEADGHTDRTNTSTLSSLCVVNNGAESIAAALENACYANNSELISTVASTISLLSLEKDFRQAIGSTRGMQILLEYVLANHTDDNLTYTVLKTMCSMLAGIDQNKVSFNKMGGMSSIIQVMALRRGCESTMEMCCQVLDIAADGQTTPTRELLLDRMKPASAVQTAMSNFPRSARIQEYSCSLLVKIANVSSREISALNRTGVETVVRMATKNYPQNAAIQSIGHQLLAMLMTDRGGRSSSRGDRANCSTRFRSRSRVMGERSRSRLNKSKSPIRDRGLNIGRAAMLTAKKSAEEQGSFPRAARGGRRTGVKMVLESVAE